MLKRMKIVTSLLLVLALFGLLQLASGGLFLTHLRMTKRTLPFCKPFASNSLR
jgi:methyl-accepting chemotaxis protein-1 (serine sensor receptor)